MHHWHHQQNRQSSISLSHLPMVLFAQQTGSDDGQNSSRRVSSASTASSLPRTPSSAQWDLQEYIWRERDPERLSSLREAFSHSDDASTSSPATPQGGSLGRASGNEHIRPGSERFGWNVEYKSPVRSLSVLSPSTEGYKHRVTRSATTSGSVRLWPQLPGQITEQPLPLEMELSELALLPDEEGDTEEEGDVSSGSHPPSESEDSALRRRRHIRRPMRAKQDLPRRLPPLPCSLVHSNSTAARFVSTPGSADRFSSATSLQESQDPRSQTQSQVLNEWDLRRRSHTISDPTTSARIRPLPSPTANASSSPVARRKVAAVPQLKLATLSLRSSQSEADAVLTKTPNRRFNPMGSNAVAPPMPQDAGSKIDWDLIGDILEIEGEMGEATPITRPA